VYALYELTEEEIKLVKKIIKQKKEEKLTC
jgi:hypothetical protein